MRTYLNAMFKQNVKSFSSMDDEDLYGRRVSSYSSREATEDGVICESRFLIVESTADDTKEWIESDKPVELESADGETILLSTEGKRAYAAACVAARKGLEHVFADNAKSKVITFHNNIANAERAVDTSHPLSIMPKLWTKKTIWTDVYHSKLSPKQKKKVMEEFKKHNGPAILACVRAIREGIDIPSIDCTVHMRAYGMEDDQGVSVELIQHIGRGKRTSPGKKYCWHILPLPAAGVADQCRRKMLSQVVEIMEEYEVMPEVLTALEKEGTITTGTLQRSNFTILAPTKVKEQELVNGIRMAVMDVVRENDKPMYRLLTMQQALNELDSMVEGG